MARIALLELPNAVMMRTLVFGELTLSFESASMPSSSGIRTSMITRSGLLSFTFSTTSVPVADQRDPARYRAGDRDQQTGVEDVSEQPADEDEWQPAQVRERDPRTEDSRARRRLGPLLEDRHSWNVEHDVCGAKQDENENG